MTPAQVIVWIERCQQNIERMLVEGVSAADIRTQYAILATIVKVVNGDAYFLGVSWPRAAPNQTGADQQCPP